ncbi:hypothetical protein PG997_005220 [Apiospora hydei]|uniref:Uncharacterized protein n=1 Tax=Apiospora hydei TaxID=1337664 RepID=A0ABR1X4H7_9PEZI
MKFWTAETPTSMTMRPPSRPSQTPKPCQVWHVPGGLVVNPVQAEPITADASHLSLSWPTYSQKLSSVLVIAMQPIGGGAVVRAKCKGPYDKAAPSARAGCRQSQAQLGHGGIRRPNAAMLAAGHNISASASNTKLPYQQTSGAEDNNWA